MLADILPPLAKLSRAFQQKDLDYILVKPLVAGTKATLQNLKTTSGDHFASLQRVISRDLEAFEFQLWIHLNQPFMTNTWMLLILILLARGSGLAGRGYQSKII